MAQTRPRTLEPDRREPEWVEASIRLERLARPGPLPLGVQIVASPGREDLTFGAAQRLEAQSARDRPRPLTSARRRGLGPLPHRLR